MPLVARVARVTRRSLRRMPMVHMMRWRSLMLPRVPWGTRMTRSRVLSWVSWVRRITSGAWAVRVMVRWWPHR